jgi:general secretion pathway protein G
MVVVVIIGILATGVTLKVTDYMGTARKNRAESDISAIKDAIETYRLNHGQYPSSTEGLEAVSDKIGKPIDPWGNRYQYNRPGRKGPYEIICFGADGTEGGEGVNADIYSWDLNTKENTGATAAR